MAELLLSSNRLIDGESNSVLANFCCFALSTKQPHCKSWLLSSETGDPKACDWSVSGRHATTRLLSQQKLSAKSEREFLSYTHAQTQCISQGL